MNTYDGRFRRWGVLLWPVLCLLLALSARVHALGRQSLWYDEAVTAQVAQQSLPELARWTANDIQPPLYYALVAGWTRLAGDSEWLLRFPSAVFGVLMVALAWALAHRLWGRRAAAMAALLAAGQPLWLYYSQEARMYTLLTALGMLAGYALLRVLAASAARTRRGWWGLFVLAALAALYTHYFALFLLLAFTLFAVSALRGRTLWREAALSAWLIALGYIPWLPVLLRRFGEDASYWQGALKANEALRHAVISFATGETMLEQAAIPWAGFTLLSALLAAAALWWAARHRPSARHGLWFSLSYLLLPVALILLLAAFTPKFNPRYLMLASPGLILLLAGGAAVALRRDRTWLLRLITAAVLLTLLVGYGVADRNWFTDPAFSKDDWRGAVQYITAHLADDEAALLVSGHAYPAWRYYASDRALIRLPDSETLDVSAVLDLRTAAELTRALADRQGVWLLQWQNEVVDPGEVVPFLLAGAAAELPVEAAFWGLGTPRHFRWSSAPDFGAATAAMQPVAANFAGQVQLVAWTQPQCPLALTDDGCQLYLVWQALAPLSRDLKLTAVLLDAEGHIWGRADQRLAAYAHPTFRWPVAVPQLGTMALAVEAGTPPGRYRLRLGVYDTATGQALDVLDMAGNPAGQAVWLEPFTLSHLIGAGKTASPALTAPSADDAALAVYLSDVRVDPPMAEAGQPLLVQAWWWPQQNALPDAVAVWQWLDAAGKVQVQGTQEAAAGYRSTQWQPGLAPVRSQWTLAAPAAVQQGDVWRLRVQLATSAALSVTLSNPFEVAVALQPSTRLFAAPPPALPLNHPAADGITLVGIDLSPLPLLPGASLPITVTWQAAAVPDAAYTGFVHLLAGGRVVAQDDHQPQRATSTWLPGEVVLERYTVSMPADLPGGVYQLEIGLYDAAAAGAPRPAPPALVDVTLGN